MQFLEILNATVDFSLRVKLQASVYRKNVNKFVHTKRNCFWFQLQNTVNSMVVQLAKFS